MSQLGQKLKLIGGSNELLYKNDGVGGIQAGDLVVWMAHHASAYPNHAAPSGFTTAWSVDAPGRWYSAVASYRQEYVGAYRIANGTSLDNPGNVQWWRWTGGPITSVSNVYSRQWTSHPGTRTYPMSSYETSDSIGTVFFEGTYFWGKSSDRQVNPMSDNPDYTHGPDLKIVFGRKTDEGVTFQTSGGSATGPGAGYNWYYIGGAAGLRLYA